MIFQTWLASLGHVNDEYHRIWRFPVNETHMGMNADTDRLRQTQCYRGLVRYSFQGPTAIEKWLGFQCIFQFHPIGTYDSPHGKPAAALSPSALCSMEVWDGSYTKFQLYTWYFEVVQALRWSGSHPTLPLQRSVLLQKWEMLPFHIDE